jgi:hypothetical protein
MKGQSAIEYLMTYGWMLLVVAVVGGAVFSVVQNDTPDTVSGFTGSDVIVDDFGVDSDDNIQLELKDGSGAGVVVSKVNVSDPETERYVYKEFTGDKQVDVGDEKIFEMPNVTRGDSGNTLNVEITYDSEGLTDLTTTGTISGELSISQTAEVTGPPTGGGSPGGSSGILTTGGSLTVLDMQNTLKVNGSDECLGDLCGGVNPGSNGDPVQISGDTMTGSLKVNSSVESVSCIVTGGYGGGACTLGTTSDTGQLSESQNTMFGYLATPELETQSNTCVGNLC